MIQSDKGRYLTMNNDGTMVLKIFL